MKLTPLALQQTIDRLLLQCQTNESATSPTIVVGLSGGLDSIVLTHLLATLSRSSKIFLLKVVHINHQLQRDADEWQSFCSDVCQSLHISFENITVNATPEKGEGPEAAARNARYVAFKSVLKENDILVTAHHLDDQIETVFLQMLRGTGIEGATGISPVSLFGNNYLLRPLLEFSRDDIQSYAEENQLTWVEDPSNQETEFSRNYLRQKVIPLIEKRWPAYRQTIQRFSENMQQAGDVLQEIVEEDIEDVIDKETNSLCIEPLSKLSVNRQNNIIRSWIKKTNGDVPSVAILHQIFLLMSSTEDAEPVVTWGQTEIRRFQNKLYCMQKNRNKIPENLEINISNWRPGQVVEVPGYGALVLELCEDEGILETYISSENIQIKIRQGGETCKPVGRQKSQSLKKIFQEKKVPPWLRNNTPIVFINGEVAVVVGEFYCSPFALEKASLSKVKDRSDKEMKRFRITRILS